MLFRSLHAAGVRTTHLHVSTIKPFTDPAIRRALFSARKAVITMENHLTVGGLGSAVAETMAEHGLAAPLHRIGLPDSYAHGASQAHLLREYGLDAMSLVETAERALGRNLGITAENLAPVRTAAVHSSAKAEAL